MLKEILEGWGNKALDTIGLLSPQLKKISENRLSICHSCKVRKGGWCSKDNYEVATKDFVYQDQQRKAGLEYHGCGCDIVAKSMLYHGQCPLGKWD